MVSKFCKFCGKILEDNQDCDCDKAVAEKESKATDEEIISSTENIEKSFEEPVIKTPTVKTEAVVKEPILLIDKEKKKKEEKEQKKSQSFAGFIIHPIRTSSAPEGIPAVSSLGAILTHALALVFFTVIVYTRLYGSLPSFTLGVLAPMASIFASAVVLFLVCLVFSQILRGGLSIKGALGAVSLSSIPWIVALISISILSFFIGILPSYIFAIMLFIASFASVFSILIYERGVNSKVVGSGRRIFIVSLATTLQITCSLIVTYFMLRNEIAMLLPPAMRNL